MQNSLFWFFIWQKIQSVQVWILWTLAQFDKWSRPKSHVDQHIEMFRPCSLGNLGSHPDLPNCGGRHVTGLRLRTCRRRGCARYPIINSSSRLPLATRFVSLGADCTWPRQRERLRAVEIETFSSQNQSRSRPKSFNKANYLPSVVTAFISHFSFLFFLFFYLLSDGVHDSGCEQTGRLCVCECMWMIRVTTIGSQSSQ